MIQVWYEYNSKAFWGCCMTKNNPYPNLLEWTDPELIDLEKTMSAVEGGTGPTDDGFGGTNSS